MRRTRTVDLILAGVIASSALFPMASVFAAKGGTPGANTGGGGGGGGNGGGGGTATPPPVLGVECGDVLAVDTVFTADLDCSSYGGGSIFLVSGSGITIDLGGFTVKGAGQTVFEVTGSNVVLKNGTVRNAGGYGVVVAYPGTTVSGVTILSSGYGYGVYCNTSSYEPGRFASVSVIGSNLVGGIPFYSSDCSVNVSSTRASGGGKFTDGFYLERNDTAYPISATFTGVTASSNGGNGLGLNGIPATISGSTMSSNVGAGVNFYNSNDTGGASLTLQNSTMSSNGDYCRLNDSYGTGICSGAYVQYAYSDGTTSLISGNTFDGNAEGGLYLYQPDGATVRNNTATNNRVGFQAVYVSLPGTSSGNVARFNTGLGFSGDPTFFASSRLDKCFGNNGGGDQSDANWTCVVTKN